MIKKERKKNIIEASLYFILICTVFILTACEKEDIIYNVENDMGELINETIKQELNNTSYIVLETYDKEITINDKIEINKIINTLSNGRAKISDDIAWVESLLWIHLYDEENELITSINLYLTIENSDTYGYAYFKDLSSDTSSNGYYYIETKDLKEILENYNIEY